MMKKALLASVLATGLILPAEAGLYVPPKPAIIKPENVEFSKHLLAMPLTMGMMQRKGSNPIQFVGRVMSGKAGATSGNSTLSLTSLINGISSSAASGDFILAAFVTGSTTDRTLSITDGTNPYTLIGSELYSNGSSHDTNLRVAYKFSTGDTTTTFGPTGATADAGACMVAVFRNVHPTTPLDVAAITATGTGSANANGGAITPVTSGAWIIVAGGGAHNNGASPYTSAPANMTGGNQTNFDGTNDVTGGIARLENWTSGTFNPDPFGSSIPNTAGFSWAGITIALRPA